MDFGEKSKTGLGQSGRLPVPDEAAQEKGRKVVRKLYKADFAKATSDADKQALGRKLLQEALMNQNPLGQYALLEAARTLALESGDGLTTFSAIDQNCGRLRIGPTPLVAPRIGNTTSPPATNIKIIQGALTVANSESFFRPKMASRTVTAPMKITRRTKR